MTNLPHWPLLLLVFCFVGCPWTIHGAWYVELLQKEEVEWSSQTAKPSEDGSRELCFLEQVITPVYQTVAVVSFSYKFLIMHRSSKMLFFCLFVLIINMQCKFFVGVACRVDCNVSWSCIPYYIVVGNELHGFGWVLQEAHNNGNGVASHSARQNMMISMSSSGAHPLSMIPQPDVGSSRVMQLALLAWLLLTENFEERICSFGRPRVPHGLTEIFMISCFMLSVCRQVDCFDHFSWSWKEDAAFFMKLKKQSYDDNDKALSIIP